MSLKHWIVPSRTALLLIDMQVDFASSNGPMDKPGYDLTAPQAAVKQAERLAEAARAAQVPLIFVRLITSPGNENEFSREWKARRGVAEPPLCREGTRGADFVGPQPAGGDYVVSKSRYSPFDGTRLDESLRAMGKDTLVIAGLTTECCVAAGVQDAFVRDYHVFIADDAVASYESDLHRGALKALAMSYATLVSSAEIIGSWKK